MKKIFYTFASLLLLVACQSDDSGSEVSTNSWSFQPDGQESGTYYTETAVLSVQGLQQLEANSKENAPSGNAGLESTLRLSFKNVNPPPTGTYKVTSYENLKNADEVVIYFLTYGDPRLGGSNSTWFSQADSGQTISYTFENGKASAKFNNITMKQTGVGPSGGKVSANISQ